MTPAFLTVPLKLLCGMCLMQSDCEYMQNIMRRINAGSGESNTVNTRGETQDQTDGKRWDTEL